MLGCRLYQALRLLPPPLSTLAERLYTQCRERVYDAEVLPGLVVPQGVPRANRLWDERLTTVAGHERGVCEWLAANLRPNDVFFDVGAHYGFYPMLVSTIQPNVAVHAFEPDVHPLAYLRRNSLRSGATRPWTIVERQVSREENDFSVTLDSYAARTQTPTIVKMDIEGAEVLAIGGGRRLVESREVEFLIEIHPEEIEELGSSVDALLDTFPSDYRRRVLVDIRNHECASWTEDMTALFTDDHPYVYIGPPEAERVFPNSEPVHERTS